MKHLLLILGLFITAEIFAQDFKKINYQINAGTIMSVPYKKTIEIWPDIENHPRTDYGSAFGYFLDLKIQYNLNDKSAIASGFNYSLFSVKIEDKAGMIENKGNISTTCLNIPLFFQYKLFNKLPISVAAGPYLGILLNAKEKGTTTYDISGLEYSESDPLIYYLEDQKYENDIKKDYKKTDAGIVVELEYKINLGSKLSGVLLTCFNYGLVNVLTNDLANYSNADKWKNYYFIIGIGIGL